MSEQIQTRLHYCRGQASGRADCGVLLRESVAHGFLILRGDADNQVFRVGVERVLGITLPLEPCTFRESGDAAICWLGPSEWLLQVATGSETSVEAELRQVLRGHFSIVDVSGGLALFELGGRNANEVLQKSCAYDFHSRNFPVGRCVQTSFAKTSALFSRASDDAFKLVIRRSFADYLAKWLLDAGEEFGCRIEHLQPAVAR